MNPLLDNLNDKQQEAVLHFEGPLLILAGAGSGKTRVLTHRIAWLIEEKKINPYQILALTFTNKAAKEMRGRVDKIVTHGAGGVWVSTFHSTCVRILRRYIDFIGYDRNFTIYDSDDQKTLMKEVCKFLDIDTKKHPEKTFLNEISSAKDRLVTPEMYSDGATDRYFDKNLYAKVYRTYQKRLRDNNALDFDDLIMLTVKLFRECENVLEHYQERFRFVLVDEYQDTNTAQFMLLSLLTSRYRNLCVVGDDDQSIYRFRGADIQNILNFEHTFPSSKVVRLEQNYRSTGNILAAANEVISHNKMRKGKSLWTDAPGGEPVSYVQFANEYEEAGGIASDIRRRISARKASYSEFAILYRTNAQSRVFEEKLIYEGIPYRIIGAINFYARKEIKDLLCYLKTVNNSADDISVKRIINIPRRGIGATTIGRITDHAFSRGISFYSALAEIDAIPGCRRAASQIAAFTSLIENFRSRLSEPGYSLKNLIDDIIDATGYITQLRELHSAEADSRIENIESLINKVVQYETDCGDTPTLGGLLEDIALIADIDTVSPDTEQVLLMTLHSAKGLEFPHVYISGMEENIFPGAAAIFGDDPAEIEEERRLCYVGITRAMKTLTLTGARQRMKNGNLTFNMPSRFLREIPRHVIKQSPDSFFTPPSGRPAEGEAGRHSATWGALPFNSGNHTPQRGTENGTGTDMDMDMDIVTDMVTDMDMVTDIDIDVEPGVSRAGRKNPFHGNPYIQKGFSKKEVSNENIYEAGDRVSHPKFGSGTVTAVTPLKNDTELCIDFEKYGVRKLRLSFAKLAKTT